MASTAQGSVEVDPVGPDVQRLDGLAEQDGNMMEIHYSPRASKAFASSSGLERKSASLAA